MADHAVIADVVDITLDRPRPADVFLVDTNVWFWQTYTRASQSGSPPTGRQVQVYPTYISRALKARSKLLRCGLSMLELAHAIERVEHELEGKGASAKDFRRVADARGKVVGEIRAAWSQVIRMAAPLNIALKDERLDGCINLLKTAPLDPSDSALIVTAMAADVKQVLTDDADYSAVPGVTLFTGNRGVIEAARAQGKLVSRPQADQSGPQGDADATPPAV
jgi:hypothetical protein